MPHRLSIKAADAERSPASLVAVNRAVSDLRRGAIVVIRGEDSNTVLAQAAEGTTEPTLKYLQKLAGADAALIITGKRAEIIGVGEGKSKAVRVEPKQGLTAWLASDVVDPLSDLDKLADGDWCVTEVAETALESAAIGLAKIARMLPAMVIAPLSDPAATQFPVDWADRNGLLVVEAEDIFHHEENSATSLTRISEAKVPLADAEHTRIVTFRPADGGIEHLAIIIGDPDPGEPLLARLHSECFTGDLLGSLRCDCGDQLRGAIAQIAAEGHGILLYLAQEGRGIGLVNKLRAYELQDRGFDTVDANEQLGFDADERVYLPAAEMLRQLGFEQVRLMTNNPLKVDSLSHCGIKVTERVPHAFPSNKHNEHYLRTKAVRSGHLF